MMEDTSYKNYFDIAPRYYASVTEALIKSGKVKWQGYYPHESFVNLLNKTLDMLSGKDPRSLWVEGAYGTGKSHAALTIKSLLEANEEEFRDYFKRYELSKDLCQKFLIVKKQRNLLAVHRIGSADIRSDQDLILAIQSSITASLKEHNIQNCGEVALREAALKWLNEKDANRNYFNNLIHEPKYAFDFDGYSVDKVMEILEKGTPEVVYQLMRNILKVAQDNGITALHMDVMDMVSWIKSIIKENELTIVFVWDEFTEYFQNNSATLTGFQTLAEISETDTFYFLIITHESSSIITNKDRRKKILDRFVGGAAVRIDLPDNTAMELMAKAMVETKDESLKQKWSKYKNELNSKLASVRSVIINDTKKRATMGTKTIISDGELQAIVPLHPYAALLLKHMSVAFNSNARSMFDFIISNDMDEAKGFKWYINKYGPYDANYRLLTIDMLWDFFTAKNQSGLDTNVSNILESFNVLPKGRLNIDQERVFKTILLLEAISLRVEGVELLRPSDRNIDLAFNGVWNKCKASSIVYGLCQEGIIFEQPAANGAKEYTVANMGGDKAQIEKIKEKIKDNIKTQGLIDQNDLLSTVSLPFSIERRFILRASDAASFKRSVDSLNEDLRPYRFKAVVLFALNDTEENRIRDSILKEIEKQDNSMLFIQSLTPMGSDLFNNYVEYYAYHEFYMKKNNVRAKGYENQALRCIKEWKKKISEGAFKLYSRDKKNGIPLTNSNDLQKELKRIDFEKYPYGLEHVNKLTETMFKDNKVSEGAACGIKQELKGAFSSNLSALQSVLEGSWKVDNYWKDPEKMGSPFVQLKLKVDELITNEIKNNSGRIEMLTIYEELEKPPYGFLPNSVTAFILGFLLKEYVSGGYSWTNDSKCYPMTVNLMQNMIANAIKKKASPSKSYESNYIVAINSETRSFLECTSKIFDIRPELCGSVPDARDQIRKKMKEWEFPIWCVKSILNKDPNIHFETSKEKISEVIDAYCGIANTANSNEETESSLAEKIGKIIQENSSIQKDLGILITNDMCKKGMRVYIAQFKDGILQKLAQEVADEGAYLECVKKKFHNVEGANWVWNSETADETIDDVILDYKIIAESNKYFNKYNNLQATLNGWKNITNNIRMPFELLQGYKEYTGNVSSFLKELYELKISGLERLDKQKFYELLCTQGKDFFTFYKNQLAIFNEIMTSLLEGLTSTNVEEFFNKIPSGQFIKSGDQYFSFIDEQIKKYRKSLKRVQLEDLWFNKTGTKDPEDWSEKYLTPILCMFDDQERSEVKKIFRIILEKSPNDKEIANAIKYLSNASFYEKLNDGEKRDACFMQRIVGDYALLLKDISTIRKDLLSHFSYSVYEWMDNSAVRNRLGIMADKEYKLNGYKRVKKLIEEKNAEELRQYLNQRIITDMDLGLAILKNS